MRPLAREVETQLLLWDVLVHLHLRAERLRAGGCQQSHMPFEDGSCGEGQVAAQE